MAIYLVHGTLQIEIFEADNLVNDERATGHAPGFLRQLVEGIQDTVGIGRGSSRLYATVDLGKARVGRTRVIEREPVHPEWHESFRIYAAHSVSHVVFTVKDDNTVGTTVIGRAKIPVAQIISGRVIEDWFGLTKDNGEAVKDGEAKIRVRVQFLAAQDDAHWGRGIGSPDYSGIPFTFFRQRRGCNIKLYQDAHMADNWLPRIRLDGGLVKQPTRCWEDVYNMINDAQHLIYITGWSVYTEIKLVRDEERMIEGARGLTLGELLKRKADQGVAVNLLVWDDRTSYGLMQKDGQLATHDEDTNIYFQDTKVCCVLCKRIQDDGFSILQGLTNQLMFTHHQKSLIVDAPVPGAKGGNHRRRILTMIGGIDLCDGRYDTPDHPLFSTLNGVHHDDFHQPNVVGGGCIEKGGPRETWHDIHAQAEGPIAWDILYNFEQRWRKQAGEHRATRLLQMHDSAYIDPPTDVTEEDDPETWNVQMFRSIDGGSVDFPDDPQDAAKCGLVSGKNNVIDRSIQDAYIHAIRRAKHYIYIENQYFLGSAYAWEDKCWGPSAPADHLIPMELTLKIVNKIEARERFAVYVVMPMWPEGVPEDSSPIPGSSPVQAILAWTHRTMEMMYKTIAQALRAVGSGASPKDYLNFYCLANREAKRDGEYEPPTPPLDDSTYKRAQDSRRFMIYVHSKMMIVDDEYIILGSANINERSMNGARDSEMAIGAYQPHRLTSKKGVMPHGQVYGFRMSLWYEHLGRLDDESFLQPGSLACVQAVNSIAEEIWDLYTQEEPCDLPGHLVPFPVAVTGEGVVTELPGMPYFPDTKAPVLGMATLLPAVLTC